MGSILKIIYDNKYGNEYLLNGVHPAVISYIQKFSNENRNVDSIKNEIASVNTDQKWSSFFRHSNFLRYYTKHFGNENIITIDEIQNDDSIYLLPIEVGTGLTDFIGPITLTVDGVTYNYTFVDTIDTRVLDKLKSGKVKLLINLIHEPLYNTETIDEVEKYFSSYGIDGSNIIIIGGNNFQEYYKFYPKNKIKITYGNLLLQQAGERLNYFPYFSGLLYISDAVNETDLNSNIVRPKKFLCWNRTMRAHRYWLAYLALKHNLLSDSYFSFLNPSLDINSLTKILVKYTSDYEESSINAEQIYKMIPYELDTHHLTAEQKRGFPTDNNKKEFYENSYVHITSETSLGNSMSEGIFFSEKTFHPILNLQPFIYIGCFDALKKLRELGFKTFHPYIDESYDDEKDPIARFKMIEKEIQKINERPIEEIHQWYYSIKDMLLHNQTQLKTFSIINPFENAFSDIKKFYTTQTS
jgi:hypothetical protein